VAPPTDECENYVACLKAQSLSKKTLQTASKLAYKRQRNACSNYAPLEARRSGLGAWQNKTKIEFGMYPQSMTTEWKHARTVRPWQSVRLDLWRVELMIL